ncbi:MAG: hypothetical protein U0324_35105 [Polyangiales bacterium]
MNTPAAGTLLDQRYELVAPAPDRGLGETWEVRDQQHGGRPVAAKFLRAVEGGAVPKELGELIKSLRAFRNDHVLTVINHGVWSGRPYLIYDRFEGRSVGDALDDARKSESPLDLALLEAVFDRVCTALHAGHKAPRQVLHLSLTPGSVLYRGGPADVAVRVVDFGVAKHAGADPTAPARSARALRSPAPEQLLPDGRPGVPADVFGLGALLREMLSLPAPLGMTLSPAGLERRRDDVPAGVWDVIARATAARPEDRYPSAAALQEALRPAWKTAPPPPKRNPLRAFTPAAPAVAASIATVDALAAQAPRPAAPRATAEIPAMPVSGPLPAPAAMVLPPVSTPLPAFTAAPMAPPEPKPLPVPGPAPSFPTEDDEDSLLSTMAMEHQGFDGEVEPTREMGRGAFDPEPTQAIETVRAVTDSPEAFGEDVAKTQDVGAAAEEFLATVTTASPLGDDDEDDAPGVGERTRVAAEPEIALAQGVGERTRVVAEPVETGDPLSRTMAVDPQALQRIATNAPPRATTGARAAALRAPTVELPQTAPAAPAPAQPAAPKPAVKRADPPAPPVAPEHTARYKIIVAIGILFIPVLLGLLLIFRRRR